MKFKAAYELSDGSKTRPKEIEQDGIVYFDEPYLIGCMDFCANNLDRAFIIVSEDEYTEYSRVICYSTREVYNNELHDMFNELSLGELGYTFVWPLSSDSFGVIDNVEFNIVPHK